MYELLPDKGLFPVCQTDNACVGFPLAGGIQTLDDGEVANMTCYKGGETVFSNHQVCNVTSTWAFSRVLALHLTSHSSADRKIVDMLPDRPPQITFSCNTLDHTCDFQFWTAQVESFYCALDTCSTEVQTGYDSNTTFYKCANMKCSCVPDRFICGEDGSVGESSRSSDECWKTKMSRSDITDFLKEEIRGPATFSCKSGAGCKFEEPAMNQLINDIFGDGYISLECEGGECLHFSQVPGYVVSRPPFALRRWSQPS